MPAPKLTSDQVIAARKAARAGARTADLAKKYGVALPTMRHAINGNSWPSVAEKPVSRDQHQPKALTGEMVTHYRNAVAAGTTDVAAAAREAEVTQTAMWAAIYGHTWRIITDPAPLPEPAPKSVSAGKLDDGKAAEIRRRYLDGESQSELATAYGVNASTIRRVIHGSSYRHVSDPPPVPVEPHGGAYVLTPEEEDEIYRLRTAEETPYSELGKRYGISKATALRAGKRAEARAKKARRR